MSGLHVLQSPLLAAVPSVRHGFFTRVGGVSAPPYDALNTGPGSGDDPAAVAENRRRAADWLGVAPGALLTGYQIHSATVLTATDPWSGERPEGDGVATGVPGLACGALAADCAPVLLVDPVAGVVAAAHAGWQGALADIPGAAVQAMAALGAKPSRIIAAVGPCIGPRSYEVGLEFLERFERKAFGSGRFFAPGETSDKRMFDLPAFVLWRLAEAGVGAAEWVGRDTMSDERLFFSNRRSFRAGISDYGRLLSAIVRV